MADSTPGDAAPRRRLPDYADEEGITADARDADLALLAKAQRRGRAFASALADLHERSDTNGPRL